MDDEVTIVDSEQRIEWIPAGAVLLDEGDQHLLEAGQPYWHMGYVHVAGKCLHRILLPKREGYETDHINRDRLDNRRDNLRYATRSENLRNRPGWGSKTGYGYKGLVLRKRQGENDTWVARITVDGKKREVGSSVNVHVAALKWNRAALAHYGEFFVLNDVPCFSDDPQPAREKWRCRTCWAPCMCCCVC